MLVSGAEYILDFLTRKGVRTVFGYPGSPVLDIYEQFYKRRGDKNAPRHVLMRHEQGACHAACGYARACGKPGVCIATSGPGATNLVTAVADAYLDSIPLIVITGQVGVGSIGRDAFQEADIMGITIPVTKHNYLVKHADALRPTLEEAWRIASSGRPGPVLVDISRDIFTARLDDSAPCDSALPRIRDNPLTLDACIDDIRAALSRCYRPVILAGGGVVAAGAGALLSDFASKYDIPVVTTLMGMGIKLDGARMLGLTGMYGTPASSAAMEQSDLVLAVGCRFSDRTVSDFSRFSHTKMLIHVDIDNAEISKNVVADIAAVCSADELFSRLLEGDMELRCEDISRWNAQLDDIFRRGKTPPATPPDRLSCREILRAVDSCEHELADAVYVCDVGNHQMTAARELEPIFERGMIMSGGLGVMGFGLPAAIGAAYALSDCSENIDTDALDRFNPLRARQIVLVCGDGGFQMTMQELAPLAHMSARLPIKVLLMDNGALGMIRTMQRQHYDGHLVASSLENPDFAAVAAAYGIKTVKLDVSSRPTLTSTLRTILTSPSTIFVHCLK